MVPFWQDEICANTSRRRPKSRDNRQEKQQSFLDFIVASSLFRFSLPGVRNTSSAPAPSVPPQQRIEEHMNLQDCFDKDWQAFSGGNSGPDLAPGFCVQPISSCGPLFFHKRKFNHLFC